MNLVSSAVAVFFLGALAIHTLPKEAIEKTEVLQPSFDIAMPAPADAADPAQQPEAPIRFAANKT